MISRFLRYLYRYLPFLNRCGKSISSVNSGDSVMSSTFPHPAPELQTLISPPDDHRFLYSGQCLDSSLFLYVSKESPSQLGFFCFISDNGLTKIDGHFKCRSLLEWQNLHSTLESLYLNTLQAYKDAGECTLQ